MNSCRSLAFGLGLVVLFGSVALGADDAEKKKRKGDFGARFGQAQPLLPSGPADKLNLSAEQKEKVAKLEKEFGDKQKGVSGKVREELKKAFENKDRDAIKTAMGQMKDVREKEQKLREEYQGEVASLLNDEQKKKFDDVKKEQPQRPFGGQFQPFGGRPGAGPAVPNQVLPPAVQDELKLTTEQKEKLSKLQKEVEGKINDVLTDEQKKKLEELKKGRATPRARPKAST